MTRSEVVLLVALLSLSACDTPPPEEYLPARAIFTDDAAEVMVQTARQYTPTQAEKKELAAFWVMVLHGMQTGEFDEALISSELYPDIEKLGSRYPGVFVGQSGSAGQKLISSKSDFSCGGSCSPSVGRVADVLSKPAKEAVFKALEKIDIQGKIYSIMKSSLEGGKGLREAIESAISDPDAEKILKGVAEAFGGVAAVTEAVTLLGVSVAGSELIATAGAIVGVGVLVYESGKGFSEIYQLSQECRQWKLKTCDPCNAIGKWDVKVSAPAFGNCSAKVFSDSLAVPPQYTEYLIHDYPLFGLPWALDADTCLMKSNGGTSTCPAPTNYINLKIRSGLVYVFCPSPRGGCADQIQVPALLTPSTVP